MTPTLPPAWRARVFDGMASVYDKQQLLAYGEACAAAAVLAERERIISMQSHGLADLIRQQERERCAKIVEEYNPGGSYHIRTVLADAIRAATAPAPEPGHPSASAEDRPQR